MRNPFRVYENFKSDSCDMEEVYFFYKLKNLFLSSITYEGLPDEIQPFWVEEQLFYNPVVAFIYDDLVDMYAAMKVNLQGMPDIYGIPELRQVWAINGYLEYYGKENSVLMWNSLAPFSYAKIARMYAKKLANIWRTIDVNIFAQRTPVVISAPDDMRLTYDNIGASYEANVPVIKTRDTVNLGLIKALKIDAPYVADKLQQQFKIILSQFLTDCGYESNPVEKRERLINGEVDGNNGETEGMRNSRLAPRIRAINACNELWGWNASVKFNSILPTSINGFIGGQMVEETGETREGEDLDNDNN